VEFIKKFFKRHKFIKFLLRFKLIGRFKLTIYNGSCFAYFDLNDPEPRNIYIKNEFEPDFFVLASKFLYPRSTIFDLGANLGQSSFGLVTSKNNHTYHLFEANLNLVKIVKKSVKVQPSGTFHLLPFCVSNKNGFTTFYLEDSQTGQSHVATGSEKGVKVKNVILNQYCREKKIERINFAKIDLEGHELSALEGWSDFLARGSIDAIYIEVIPENQIRYNHPTNCTLIFLEKYGYKLFLCKEEDWNYWNKSPEIFTFNNISIELVHINAISYPPNYSTDILAISPILLQSFD
jgi:FkbM family methyltransferase